MKANYEIQPDKTVKVFNKMIINGVEKNETGSAEFAGEPTEGKLIVNFNGTTGKKINKMICFFQFNLKKKINSYQAELLDT